MRTRLNRSFALALLAALLPAGAGAESMPWTAADAFEPAMSPYLQKWMEPSRLAVRVKDGRPEYKVEWIEDSGAFSFATYATTSRAEAEDLIHLHADAKNLIGGPSRLCLHKFARAVDGDNEYYLLYLVDEEQSGLRCISLPAQ